MGKMKVRKRTHKEQAAYLRVKVTELMMELQDKNKMVPVIEEEMMKLKEVAENGECAMKENVQLHDVIEQLRIKVDDQTKKVLIVRGDMGIKERKLHDVIALLKGKIDHLECVVNTYKCETRPLPLSSPNRFAGDHGTLFQFDPSLNPVGPVIITRPMFAIGTYKANLDVPLEDILAFVGTLVLRRHMDDMEQSDWRTTLGWE